MDKSEDETDTKLNSLDIGLIVNNIASLNLSRSNIKNFSEQFSLPVKLEQLNLSHNNLESIAKTILEQKYIKTLDISFNKIKYFDDTPSFCQNIEELNISHNILRGPPAWIWFDSPKKLMRLNISCNKELSSNLKKGDFENLIQYKTRVTNLKIHNCQFHNCLKLLSSFPKVEHLQVGDSDMSYFSANAIRDFPCEGLMECYDLTTLDMSYLNIFNIKPSIDIYKKLIKINLSLNELSALPNEFCNLENLEECILSCNRLWYLPDDINRLIKLHTLCIDSNELCMLPPNLCSLPNLKKLDLYQNHLCEVPPSLNRIEAIDLAQNYMEEPDDSDYIKKKEILRVNCGQRWNGRKYEVPKSESIYSEMVTDDESNFLDNENVIKENGSRPPSSIEDWDSDEYWVPHQNRYYSAPQTFWVHFVKQKMEEGNFCPMDSHAVSVTEQVKYEKLCNPRIQYESDGQFDDYSSDDS